MHVHVHIQQIQCVYLQCGVTTGIHAVQTYHNSSMQDVHIHVHVHVACAKGGYMYVDKRV